MRASDRCHHLSANGQFAQAKGRGAEVHNHLRAFLDQTADQFRVVERTWQIFPSPNVFADRDPDLATGDDENFSAMPRLEVTVLVKYVIGGQECLESLANRPV